MKKYKFSMVCYILQFSILSRQRITKTLIRLRGCAGWSVSMLFAYGKNRFSHDVAQLISSSLFLIKYPFINSIWLLIRIVDTSHWKWTENCAIFYQIHFRLLFEVVKFYSKLCSGVLIYVPHIYSFIIYLYYIPCINLVLFFSEIVLISSRVKYFTSDDIIYFHISLVMIWLLQWRHHNVVNIQSNCRNAWFWRHVTWYDAIVNVTWRRVNGWHILTHFLKHIVEKGM